MTGALRALDDRVLPRAARALRAVLGRTPADRRRRAPLLAVVPALLAVLAVAALLDRPVPPAGPVAATTSTVAAPDPVAAPEPVVGPAAGQEVQPYVDSARARTEELALRSPAEARVALVSLDAPLAVDAAERLVAGLQVRSVLLRADGAVDAAGDLAAAAALPGRPEVVGLLVEGPGVLLGELLGQPGVRTVELGPAGVPAEVLEVRLLLPEAVGTVPADDDEED